MKVLYFHLDETEALRRAKSLKGFDVVAVWSIDDLKRWAELEPEVVIISLDRCPQMGLELAHWWVDLNHHCPGRLVLHGGPHDQQESFTKRFPKAGYSPDLEHLEQYLRSALVV